MNFLREIKLTKQCFNILLGIFLLSSSNLSYSQVEDNYKITYVSPKPSSVRNSPYNNIIIRTGENLNKQILGKVPTLNVTGSKSGPINGRLIISDDNRSLIFLPHKPYIPSEMITVTLKSFFTSQELLDDENRFSFFVSDEYPADKKFALELYLKDTENDEEISNRKVRQDKAEDFSFRIFPENYPKISVKEYNEPTPGLLFMSIFGSTETPSLLISDNIGNPIYYLQRKYTMYDFKKQSNGLLTFYDEGSEKFYAMNSNYEIVDSFACGNGFETDIHELLILSNGHSLLLGIDPQIIDMSMIVPGGKEDALVLGYVIQELDLDKNVVFQWKSLDYIDVIDASDAINLTAQVIDYIHCNSIFVDFDNNLLLSSRHLDEITKINRETGDIIWRMGGKRNQYTLMNEQYEFSHQHDIRRLANNNLMLFDNGSTRNPQFSRVVEYEVDEVNKIITKIWQYRNVPDYFTNAMGNARRLANGNTIISWGKMGIISEVRYDGIKALELQLPEETFTYRVLKSDWKTSLYTSSVDTLFFEDTILEDSTFKTITLSNNSSEEISITGVYNTLPEFYATNNFPVTLPPNDQGTIQMKFQPKFTGYYLDTLNIRSDSDTSVINTQVIVIGSGVTISSAHTEEGNFSYQLKQNFPNPFNPSTTIKFNLPAAEIVKLNVYNVLGQKVKTLVNGFKDAGIHKIEFNAEQLPGGIYIYQIITGRFSESKKMILIK